MRPSLAPIIALLICVFSAFAIADDEQARIGQIIAGLHDREAKIANTMRFSAIRSRNFRQVIDPGGGEPECTLTGFFCVRQPNLARSRNASFRNATPTSSARWDPTSPDWEEISAIGDMRVSPTEALMLRQMSQHPDQPEKPELYTFEPFPFDGPHRYDAPTSNPNAAYLGFMPGQLSTASELLSDPAAETHLGERTKIDGVECSKLTAKSKSGSFDFWVDDASRIRKLEVYRGAFDDYGGRPIWKFALLGDDSKRDEPTDGERQTYMREVHIFSDFKEVAPGVLIPHQLDTSFERRDPEGEVHISTSKGTIEALVIQDKPFPESDTRLDVPEGTRVHRLPIDQVKREWRDGKIIVVEPADQDPPADRK